MPRTQHGTTEKGTRKKKTLAAGKASALLHEDHVRVQDMFKEYRTADASRKQELARTICSELTVHTRIEEELFYPSLRDASDRSDLVNEAEVEHASAKQLIKEIEGMQPNDRLFDARVTVLGEYVNHHIREEEEQMFPQAEKSGIDTPDMAEQLKKRKQELQQQVH
ncbi:MAG TPA: hemerythrin domain-containing protein [Gammaproteobacteria bacterium]